VLLVPGIEYEVIHDGAIIHVGAIGVLLLLDKALAEKGLVSLVDAIHQYGGLAVLHHPNNVRKVLTRNLIELFDFIELWNTKFDCGFGPNSQFLRWLRDMECQGPYLVSADIHDVRRFKQDNIVFIDVGISEGLQLSTIVDRLKELNYRCRVGNWVVFPNAAWQVPNFLYRILPFVCLVKKKLFRVAGFAVPEKYRKAVFKFVNRSWIR